MQLLVSKDGLSEKPLCPAAYFVPFPITQKKSAVAFASHFGYFPVFIPSIGADRIAASKVSGNSSRYRTPMAPPME